MRIKHMLIQASLAGFAASLAGGCTSGEEIKLAPAPVVKETPPQDLPKVRKGGGSGLMKRNPGGDT